MADLKEMLFREAYGYKRRTLYTGLEHIREINPHTPVIIVFSHKNHPAMAGAGSEPRHIESIVRNFPGTPRSLQILVRDAATPAGRVRQRISPIHAIVATREMQPDDVIRKEQNRILFQKLATLAIRKQGRLVVAIAPDSGKTLADYPSHVDPDRVNAGGVALLQEEFDRHGFPDVPVIPVAIDHDTGNVGIGPDCSAAFRGVPGDQKPQVLAAAINSVQL